MGLRFGRLPEPKIVGRALLDFLHSRRLQALVIENARQEHADSLGDFIGFHMIRDPRDIIVSGYFSHLNSHSDSGLGSRFLEHRQRLRELPEELGLIEEISYSEQRLKDLQAWNYRQPNVLELRYEDAVFRPYEVFLEVFEFLKLRREELSSWFESFTYSAKTLYNGSRSKFRGGMRLPGLPVSGISSERLLGIIYRHRFQVMSQGRVAGQENVNHHYRKGLPGDWRNYLTQEHLDLLEVNHPALLQTLGYENVTADMNSGLKVVQSTSVPIESGPRRRSSPR
jgi:hypothetical protein